jgi:hypothetical protein
MSFPLYSQRDVAWASVPCGWGPPDHNTIGEIGCLETDFAMIASDSGHTLNPAQLNQLLISKAEYVSCGGGDVDHDCLPDNALDIAIPGEYQTRHVSGFDSAGIGPAVNSPDTYVILWISTAAVPSHFVIAYSPDAATIADPWTGTLGRLAGYGGPGAVHKTTYVRHVPPPPPPPPPVPPPPGPPVPTPTPVPMALYTFITGDDTHPPDQVTTAASAIEQAHEWYDQYHADIQVREGGVAGPVVFQLPDKPSGGS